MSDELDVKQFLAGYLAEAEEHLSSASAHLLSIDNALRSKENDPKSVRELFRNLHTLKGLSAMVGAEPIVNLAHEMESLLRSADRAGGVLPARAIDVLTKGIRAIEERVASMAKGEAPASVPKTLLDALTSLQIDTTASSAPGALSLDPEILAKLSRAEQEQLLQGLAKGRRGLTVQFVPSEARAAAGLTISAVRERVGKVADIVKVVPRSIRASDGGPSKVAFVLVVLTQSSDESIAEAVDADASEIQVVRALEEEADGAFDIIDPRRRNFVRVDVSRLDDALERLSQLVVNRSRLTRALRDLAESRGTLREVMSIVNENGRQLRDLRGAIMRARMVPVADMLDRAPLLVRGLSRSSHKKVRLTIDAGKSELDKGVADRLLAAILHLLRNAVDHAIEPPQDRIRAGKPEEGHIRVTCFDRSDGRLELTVADDGRGVDREKVAKRAGCPVPTDDDALLALLARTGLSTLDEATHTSGRGIGMDIVKRTVVDELGGELRVRTTRTGTIFTMVVPLSVAVVDVFSFTCAGRTFVVPVSAVDELADIAPEQVKDAPSPEHRGVAVRLLSHRGGSVPLFALSSLLGLAESRAWRPKAIIVKRASETFAFQVDSMIGQQDVVVRPLGDPLVAVEGVSGSTDLGDGSPTLVLDLPGLLRKSRASTKGAAS
jgi:two-component system chemotaxis sensor kinase CheA